jgi:hypothetical protein
MKIHLIGSEIKTICGKGLDEVEYVLKIKDSYKEICKKCLKYAKEFQK